MLRNSCDVTQASIVLREAIPSPIYPGFVVVTVHRMRIAPSTTIALKTGSVERMRRALSMQIAMPAAIHTFMRFVSAQAFVARASIPPVDGHVTKSWTPPFGETAGRRKPMCS